MTTIYTCNTCGKRYMRQDGLSVSCCVIHPPGDCCHAFEERVTKKGKPKRPHGDSAFRLVLP